MGLVVTPKRRSLLGSYGLIFSRLLPYFFDQAPPYYAYAESEWGVGVSELTDLILC